MEKGQVSRGEEIVNAVTHGVGAVLAIAGLVLLVVFSSLYGTVWHVVSFSIFGTTMVILYTMSTLYHSFGRPRVRNLFRKFDHMSIFLLIAGTYTPFCLTILNGWVGWTIFGVVWFCAISGIVMKAFFTGRAAYISTTLYIVMGWVIVFFITPVYQQMSAKGFTFLLVGGLAYTLGVFFFVNENIKFSHGIWHAFVLAGTTFHFFAVITLL